DGSLSPVTTGGGPTWGTHSGPYALAIAPNDQFVYVIAYGMSGAGFVDAFSINSDGSLNPLGEYPAGDTPQSLAISPNSQYLYVANVNDDNVQLFLIGSDGTLTSPTTNNGGLFGGTGVKGPRGVVVTPDGNYLFVANTVTNVVAQFSINSDGSLTQSSSAPTVATGSNPQSVAIDPSGTYVYVGSLDDGTLWQYSISGGLLTPLSPSNIQSGSGAGVTSVTVAP
ncbi:MAG TPA: beta-propeller fold lactonase family protein, partial [Steroidobacteraceae bacterium]|nr:beta-propeller fold lactonase family protein [Steroidobacteraceae bacterium]